MSRAQPAMLFWDRSSLWRFDRRFIPEGRAVKRLELMYNSLRLGSPLMIEGMVVRLFWLMSNTARLVSPLMVEGMLARLFWLKSRTARLDRLPMQLGRDVMELRLMFKLVIEGGRLHIVVDRESPISFQKVPKYWSEVIVLRLGMTPAIQLVPISR